jgi:hypothetical protein
MIMSINADTLALARMDDDGYGCAITAIPVTPERLSRYLEVKHAYEAIIDKWGRTMTPGDPVPAAAKRIETLVNEIKDSGGYGGPSDPACCERYGFLHEPAFSTARCRWYGLKTKAGA